MIDRGKCPVLGVGVDVIDYEAAVQAICQAAHEKRPYSVTALAVHGVITGALDATHRYRLAQFDLVTPDGQPVRWALKFLHNETLADRVYGPTLMSQICARAAREGLSIFLFGSRKSTLELLSNNLKRQFLDLRIAGMEPSRFRQLDYREANVLARRIASTRPDIVFVGLGCPRQEIWTFENVKQLSCPVIAVGAAFDFQAGLLRQAPEWMQRRGLEWLFRLAAEPRRLWRRYALLNPLYLALITAQRIGLAHWAAPREPSARCNFG